MRDARRVEWERGGEFRTCFEVCVFMDLNEWRERGSIKMELYAIVLIV